MTSSADDSRDRDDTPGDLPDELTEVPSDDFADDLEGAYIEPTSRPVRFARHSAAGAVLNGVALGLKEVLEPEREEAPIIQVLPGEPPEPGWVDTEIDPLDPAASQVTVRPWHDDAE